MAVAGLLGGVLGLGGCAAGGAGPSGRDLTAAAAPSQAAVPGPVASVVVRPTDLTASVEQYRRDAQRGVLQVKVTNGGDAPVHVTRVRLDTPTFTGPVEADKDSRVAPGVSADLTVPLGDPACPPVAQDQQHTVTLEVDGSTVELPVGSEVLGPVAVERCTALAVAEQVGLSVADGWVDAGEVRGKPVLRGAVLATPRPGAGDLALTVEGATTLFTVAEPSQGSLPAGSTTPVTVGVTLSVTRCDPHAVAEDKKGYLLPVRVSVDGAQAVLVEVAVPVPERAPLQDLVDRTCGFV